MDLKQPVLERERTNLSKAMTERTQKTEQLKVSIKKSTDLMAAAEARMTEAAQSEDAKAYRIARADREEHSTAAEMMERKLKLLAAPVLDQTEGKRIMAEIVKEDAALKAAIAGKICNGLTDVIALLDQYIDAHERSATFAETVGRILKANGITTGCAFPSQTDVYQIRNDLFRASHRIPWPSQTGQAADLTKLREPRTVML